MLYSLGWSSVAQILYGTAGLGRVTHQLALCFLLVFDGLLVVPVPLTVHFSLNPIILWLKGLHVCSILWENCFQCLSNRSLRSNKSCWESCIFGRAFCLSFQANLWICWCKQKEKTPISNRQGLLLATEKEQEGCWTEKWKSLTSTLPTKKEESCNTWMVLRM